MRVWPVNLIYCCSCLKNGARQYSLKPLALGESLKSIPLEVFKVQAFSSTVFFVDYLSIIGCYGNQKAPEICMNTAIKSFCEKSISLVSLYLSSLILFQKIVSDCICCCILCYWMTARTFSKHSH